MARRKIIATIEARIASSRLPGKVLLPVLDRPLLQHMIERVQKSGYIEEVVIALPEGSGNDPIIELAKRISVPYYQGSEDDVLSRVVDTVRSRNADILVQLTGDCPLMDYRLIDTCVEKYLENKWDYVANDLVRTYPIGFDVAVMSFDLLASTLNEPDLDDVDREHVTTYLVERPERFRLCNVTAPADLSHPEIQVTLDTPEDYEVIRNVFENLYPGNRDFSAGDVIRYLLESPNIARVNEQIKRKSKRP
jgi:spore coat polysaccharide biosynthesis protein SpsF (cytidylyltransferase family)